MAFQPSADSFGIRRLGFKCSWWHLRQAHDAVATERSIFSRKYDYKSFFRAAVNTYVPIFRGLSRYAWWQKTTNRHTHGTIIKGNDLCLSKHVTESIRNISCGVGIN